MTPYPLMQGSQTQIDRGPISKEKMLCGPQFNENSFCGTQFSKESPYNRFNLNTTYGPRKRIWRGRVFETPAVMDALTAV
jgi:hypothetical protein